MTDARTTETGLTGDVVIAVDCRDQLSLSRWWHALLGGRHEIDKDGDAVVQLDNGQQLIFLPVPEAKQVKNRLHLDLRSSDFDLAVHRALELGATKADDVCVGDRWQVLRDPEGNEFCILR